MASRGRVVLARANINELLRGDRGAVVNHIRDITRRTTALAQLGSPVDDGLLRGSWKPELDVSARAVTGRVSSDKSYAIFVLRGTGIYGPRRRIITPKNKKVLRFQPKKMGPLRPGERNRSARNRPYVFARFVRGVQPNPFLQEAFETACPYPVVRTD